MRDFLRLREQLRLLLLCAPLAACGPKASDKPADPDGKDPIGNETGDKTPPNQDQPWPEAAGGCGNWGEWCGTIGQVTKAAGTSSAAGCPESLDHDGLQFYIDKESEHAQQHKTAGTCCYSYNDGCVIGRPLLEDGRAHVAATRDGGAWPRKGVAPAPAMPDALRAALADGWLADALLEHASVASFARATLELMALGAPPELLAECQRAGLDEVRHAEGCFALAERYAGRRISPAALAPLASRPADLARLAADTFEEGCVAETVATLAATRVLAACTDPEVARLLQRIVRDETRHAALAWRTIAWAVGEGGAPVAAAIRARAKALVPRTTIKPAADRTLLAHGRLDARTRIEAAFDAWREIIHPTLDEILGGIHA